MWRLRCPHCLPVLRHYRLLRSCRHGRARRDRESRGHREIDYGHDGRSQSGNERSGSGGGGPGTSPVVELAANRPDATAGRQVVTEGWGWAADRPVWAAVSMPQGQRRGERGPSSFPRPSRPSRHLSCLCCPCYRVGHRASLADRRASLACRPCIRRACRGCLVGRPCSLASPACRSTDPASLRARSPAGPCHRHRASVRDLYPGRSDLRHGARGCASVPFCTRPVPVTGDTVEQAAQQQAAQRAAESAC